MLFEGWGTRFPKVSWLCVDGCIQLDVGIVSLGEIYCFPCIPNTWLHNQKVSGVYRWDSSSSSISSRRYLVCDWVILTTYLFQLYLVYFIHQSLFKWLLTLLDVWCLLWNSFVHPCLNVYCEDYMLQFLSVDSTCLSVYQDANGCHPLQDGSANASESGTQWWESGEPSTSTSASGGMASFDGSL